MSAKFPSSYRLLLAVGFDHAIKAENISDRCYKIFYINNGRTNARLGIVASKKILFRSTDRNAAKRLIRETFRHHRVRNCKCDIVIMVRPLYLQDVDRRKTSLASLLTKVESRCADW